MKTITRIINWTIFCAPLNSLCMGIDFEKTSLIYVHYFSLEYFEKTTVWNFFANLWIANILYFLLLRDLVEKCSSPNRDWNGVSRTSCLKLGFISKYGKLHVKNSDSKLLFFSALSIMIENNDKNCKTNVPKSKKPKFKSKIGNRKFFGKEISENKRKKAQEIDKDFTYFLNWVKNNYDTLLKKKQ